MLLSRSPALCHPNLDSTLPHLFSSKLLFTAGELSEFHESLLISIGSAFCHEVHLLGLRRSVTITSTNPPPPFLHGLGVTVLVVHGILLRLNLSFEQVSHTVPLFSSLIVTKDSRQIHRPLKGLILCRVPTKYLSRYCQAHLQVLTPTPTVNGVPTTSLYHTAFPLGPFPNLSRLGISKSATVSICLLAVGLEITRRVHYACALLTSVPLVT